MLKIIYFIILSGFMALIVFLGYSGLFYTVKIEEVTSKNYTLVYKRVQGEYRQVGEIASEVAAFMKEKFIKEQSKFGLFFDNPQKTDGDDLKSIAGVILHDDEFGRIDEIKNVYNVSEYISQTVLRVEFPYRNQASIVLGVLQVYPKLKQYIKKNPRYAFNPVLEIYDLEKGKIVYLMSILTKDDLLPEYWGNPGT